MVYGKNASSDAFFYAQTMTIREQCRDDRQNEGAMCEAAWSALPLPTSIACGNGRTESRARSVFSEAGSLLQRIF
jgi:hypothetical protein